MAACHAHGPDTNPASTRPGECELPPLTRRSPGVGHVPIVPPSCRWCGCVDVKSAWQHVSADRVAIVPCERWA